MKTGAEISYNTGRFAEYRISNKETLLRNERGVALMVVMLLSVILLGIMASLVYMLVASTQVSGIQKRYKTAIDAGKGGTEVAFEVIAMRGNPDLPGLTQFKLTKDDTTCTTYPAGCLIAKLNNPTSAWPANCYTGSPIDVTQCASYDMFFELGTTSKYQVYAKIVDTVDGNSAADLGLQKQGVVTSNTGEVQAMSKPYLYTLEVQAQNKDNPAERAQYSILYQY